MSTKTSTQNTQNTINTIIQHYIYYIDGQKPNLNTEQLQQIDGTIDLFNTIYRHAVFYSLFYICKNIKQLKKNL